MPATTEALLSQVCADLGIPDLGRLADPLIEKAEFCGILLEVMQTKLSLDEQHKLLRDVCMNPQNLEGVVYAIDRIVPVVDEEKLCALDELKFQVNPDRFKGKVDRDTEEWDVLKTAKKKLLDEEEATLKALILSLERQLDDSPSTPKTPGGASPSVVAAGGGLVSTWGERRVLGPNGHMVNRMRRKAPDS